MRLSFFKPLHSFLMTKSALLKIREGFSFQLQVKSKRKISTEKRRHTGRANDLAGFEN
jgi:hypothetical protein